ncbi:hypothetical protein KP509_20G006200 [Ceratopteris richardii]|uniref:DUF7950 domain-containing protein n=1 Tax=Ceratopteris richardii TaxID=49495 RepID=A0A8T2SDC4_CERRI|nr:hypothetical protein KP509_20G006200 [Ceratopteris richardii]
MLPPKTDRVLPRFRPIAPKPSASYGITDPSSTVSADFFSTPAKSRRSRKRKGDDDKPAAPKSVKARRPITSSGFNNTVGDSSVSQGLSDGTVPLRDRLSETQIPYGSIRPREEEDIQVTHIALKEASNTIAADISFAPFGRVFAPMYVAHGGHLLQPEGLHMPPGVNAHHPHRYNMMRNRATGCRFSNMSSIDKDSGFMERAAAASATAMHGKASSTLQSSGSQCIKAVATAGGSFTEMIRGITRLPTAADVQSLMQARVSPCAPIGHHAAAVSSNSMGLRSSPICSSETLQPKSDPSPLSSIASRKRTMRSDPSQTVAAQACEDDASLLTLPLLPNIPTRTCSSNVSSSRICPPASAAIPCCASQKLELPAIQVPSSGFRSFETSLQSPLSSMQEPLREAGTRHGRPTVDFGKRAECLQVGARVPSDSTSIPTSSMGAPNGSVTPIIKSSITQDVIVSPVMADGAVVNEGYLERAYGGSEEPVLLTGSSGEVLWSNKSYDRARKYGMERVSEGAMHAGPYIDPLVHPTPLSTLLFPGHGEPVRATLWGFLRKLVIQENKLCPEKTTLGLVNELNNISVRDSYHATACSGHGELASEMDDVVVSHRRLIRMTLESITELQEESPAASESVEAVQERMEAASDPAFITDGYNRVKWINKALQKMVDPTTHDLSKSQPYAVCSKDLGVPFSSSSEVNSAFVMCSTENVPRSACAFSCRINLELRKGGRRRSMTVPCDVSHLAASGTEAQEGSWLWQLDMAVNLSLHSPSCENITNHNR